MDDKGLVENLVGYVKSDLMIPEELSVADLAAANAKGAAWGHEVNAQVHSEICATPVERLAKSASCAARCRRCGPGRASSWRAMSTA